MMAIVARSRISAALAHPSGITISMREGSLHTDEALIAKFPDLFDIIEIDDPPAPKPKPAPKKRTTAAK